VGCAGVFAKMLRIFPPKEAFNETLLFDTQKIILESKTKYFISSLREFRGNSVCSTCWMPAMVQLTEPEFD